MFRDHNDIVGMILITWTNRSTEPFEASESSLFGFLSRGRQPRPREPRTRNSADTGDFPVTAFEQRDF